jgi:hypothetical protein
MKRVIANVPLADFDCSSVLSHDESHDEAPVSGFGLSFPTFPNSASSYLAHEAKHASCHGVGERRLRVKLQRLRHRGLSDVDDLRIEIVLIEWKSVVRSDKFLKKVPNLGKGR